ncbi:response regulator [Haloferax namakaokahaiae]|uniref:Response regulator n=1 Tax=Haloferax namakaokahaiae TaxID=1748331 RepID=A0ABD5ZBA3_9EURY
MHRHLAVLHVDDDPDMLALSKAAFERVDSVSLETATSAAQALDVLDETHIDCVVSDSLVLPNGTPLVTAINQHDDDLPILLFTAKEWVEVADIATSAGVAEYVQKAGPDDLSTVLKRVEGMVNESDEFGSAFEAGESALQEALSTHADAASKASLGLAEEWDLIGQWVGERELPITIIEAVEEHAGLTAIEEPLFDAIDPEALQALLEPLVEEQAESNVEVRFEYGAFELAVTSAGDIYARPRSAALD